MERKTYYMVRGVSSTESPRGIRAAYRDLAKRLHPDVAGEQADSLRGVWLRAGLEQARDTLPT